MKAHKITSKIIGFKNKRLFSEESLYGLNDGRLAIGGNCALFIYNMKKYKVDITIEEEKQHPFILQLKDNTLFYNS